MSRRRREGNPLAIVLLLVIGIPALWSVHPLLAGVLVAGVLLSAAVPTPK